MTLGGQRRAAADGRGVREGRKGVSPLSPFLLFEPKGAKFFLLPSQRRPQERLRVASAAESPWFLETTQLPRSQGDGRADRTTVALVEKLFGKAARAT